jgi:hypothetical protein
VSIVQRFCLSRDSLAELRGLISKTNSLLLELDFIALKGHVAAIMKDTSKIKDDFLRAEIDACIEQDEVFTPKVMLVRQ